MGIFNEQIPTDKISTNVQGQQGPPGPQGIGFKLDPNNNYDMQNKKLVNVDSGTNAEDAINNSQLDTKTILLQNASPGTVVNNKAVIYSDTGSVHTKSVYFEDIPGPGDDGLSNQMRLLTPHQSFNNIHLNIPDLKNFDGNGGRMSSEMMVTSVDQTVTGKKVFQNIEVPTPTSNNQASNKYYVDHNFLNRLTGGQIGGDLDMRGHTIKYLKLDNTDSAAARVAELKTKVDLSGSTMTGNLNMGNKQITNLGYSISDPTDVINLGFSDQKYLQKVSDSDLDMDDHRIKNSLEPVNGRDLTTKNYVDNQMGTKADLSKMTTQTFQGRIKVPDFNSGSHSGSDIVNLKYLNDTFLNKNTGGILGNSLSFISSLPSNQRQIFNLAPPQFSSSATPKSYVDGEIAKIPQSPQVNTSQFIRKDGIVPMTANLDLGGNKITNLRLPTNDEDAASKKYIDETLEQSHLLASSKKNEFLYLDSPDDTSSEYNIVVNGFVNDFIDSPHRNKKAYSITLRKDAGTTNYRSRMGFKLYPQPLGTYTMIFEFFPPEMTNIDLSVQATSAYIHKQVQKNFSSYSKILVQINNNSKQTPDYIYLTMHGTATATPVKGYLIVYGTKDWSDSLNPEIYDHVLTQEMFEYDVGKMKMNNQLDMNNKKIINLKNGTDPTDAINKRQLDEVESNIIENAYKKVFDKWFFNFVDGTSVRIDERASGLVVYGYNDSHGNAVTRFFDGRDSSASFNFFNDVDVKYGFTNSNFLINEKTSNSKSTSSLFGKSFSQLETFINNFKNGLPFFESFTFFCSVKLTKPTNFGFVSIILSSVNENDNNMFGILETRSGDFELRYGRVLNVRKLRLPNLFKLKSLTLWFSYDKDDRELTIGISNYSAQLTIPNINLSGKRKYINIKVSSYKISRFGWTDRYIAWMSPEHHKLMAIEKINGSYFLSS